MKIIRNTSMQGLSLHFATKEGPKAIFLAPKQQVEVPDSWKSRVTENLVHRRMIKLTHVPDPAPVVAPLPPVKRTRTKKPVESD